MKKRINPSVLPTLKNALSNIYWFKNDLVSFLKACVSSSNIEIVGRLDLSKPKYQIASDFVNVLIQNEERYQEELLSTIIAVCSIESFSHFNYLDNGKELKEKALVSVAVLKKEAKNFLDEVEQSTLKQSALDIQQKVALSIKDFKEKIKELKDEYYSLSMMTNHQQRGYDFEKFLNELFTLFDIESKKSFKIFGEQIDGAFTLDSTEYLVEAKWQTAPVNKSDIYSFMGKVSNKLKNTLGLYVSINGFTEQEYSSSEIKSIILCDSIDLVNVLEARIDLKDLIRRKKQEASRTGNVFFRVL
jgi:predicted Mrr-cat superfamily restriction endonuclease